MKLGRDNVIIGNVPADVGQEGTDHSFWSGQLADTRKLWSSSYKSFTFDRLLDTRSSPI